MLGQDVGKLTNEQGKIVESYPMPVDSPFKDKVDIYRLKYLSDGLKIVGFLLRRREKNPIFPPVPHPHRANS